jgi:hypothetical protein
VSGVCGLGRGGEKNGNGGRWRWLIRGDARLFVCSLRTDLRRWLRRTNNNQQASGSIRCDMGWMTLCTVLGKGGGGCNASARRELSQSHQTFMI